MLQSEIYDKLINYQDIEKIISRRLKKAYELSSILQIINIEKADFAGFPYILVHEQYNENLPVEYFARYMSTALDLSDICSEADNYYFPFISIPDEHPRLTEKFRSENLKGVLAHEICHLKTLLFYVDNHPEYYSNLEKYSLDQIKRVKDLKKSLFFEIKKRLLLEPPALKLEYELGNQSILIPFLIFTKELHCENATEFVKINLYGELHGLLEAYKEKFPEHKEEIESIFKEIIESQTLPFPEKSPFLEIKNIYNYIFKKLGLPGF